ncbi:MAG TPA: glycosyl transferase family 36, partial [Firmicutes bacterium]|nr:glycosyl transferase family 36 [Bacillota bacterium]
ATTPDSGFDLALNLWSKYQSWVTFHWSRMVSYYIGGGSVIGFRDSCQDLLGILPMDPQAAARKLRELLRHQFADGGTLHNWDPVADTGPRTGHSDDALWPILAVSAYVKETGDIPFLDEMIPFYGGGEGSVLEHLQRSLDFTLARVSSRGIPLLGAADWNDGLDQAGTEGRGESVMTAHFLVWMLEEAATLLEATGNRDQAHRYRMRRQEIAHLINQYCWDGEWYVRGTTDQGEVFGSRLNRWGRIYVNAQSWAVLSGAASAERGRQAMDSVWKHLDTPYGPAIFLPAYQEVDPSLGIITMFAPGTKENGTIFNHPVTWAILAECRLGRGDKAYEMFRKSSFVNAAADQDRYAAEPYVYAEYVQGPNSAHFGRGEFTWTTGTAAWAQVAGYQGILGAQPVLEGLRVDPCVPPQWDGFQLRRTFRRATYLIEVENPERVSRGVRRLTLDGQDLPGQILPPLEDGKEHRVHVLMGHP